MQDDAKPFLEHLEEFRWMMIKVAITLLLAMMASFAFVPQILQVIYEPMRRAGMNPMDSLRVLGPPDSFTLALQVAFVAGTLMAFPLVLYFISEFVLPALTPMEKGLIWPAFAAGTILFLLGVLFCYYLLLPASLRFFVDYGNSLGFQQEWTVQNYIDFTTQMLLAMGLSFELPMVVLALAKLGLVNAAMLRHYRRHVVVVIVIFAAVITPTSDIFSLALMALPMWLLFEGSVWVCAWMESKAR